MMTSKQHAYGRIYNYTCIHTNLHIDSLHS